MVTMLLFAVGAILWLLELAFAARGGDDLWVNVSRAVALAVSAIASVRVLEGVVTAGLLKSRRRGEASELLRALVTLSLYLIALVVVLRFGLGRDISAVVATSAVLTVIIGLALQPTLGNLFAGVSIEIEGPLRVGDYLRQGEVEGRVEALRWRSVSVRTAGGSLYVLPNNELNSRAVEVIPAGRPVRFNANFAVPAQVPPGQVIRIAKHCLGSNIEGVLDTPAPSVVVTGVDPLTATLRYAARVFLLDALARGLILSDVTERLWYALSREGIEMVGFDTGVCAELAPDAETGEPGAEAVALRARPPWSVPALPRGRVEPVEADWLAGKLDGLGVRAAQTLLDCGLRRRYSHGEDLDSDDLRDAAAVVLRGQVRESYQEDELLLGLTVIHRAESAVATRRSLPEDVLAPVLRAAARELGPIGRTVVRQAASQTDDPFFVYHEVARWIADAAARERFLSGSPQSPSRSRSAGALIGWARLMGLEQTSRRRWAVRESELLVVSRADLREALGQARDLASLGSAIAAQEFVRKELDELTLRVWIGAAAVPPA